jgi:microcystin-dependent protein
MSEPFIGEVRLYPYGRIPSGWAACQGQTLAINQNQALFSILGITYGGNGSTTFCLPNLGGRVAVGAGNNAPGGGTYVLGQAAGEASHTLTANEMPQHNHLVNASSTDATASTLAPGVSTTWAASNAEYGPATSTVAMSANAITPTGGSLPHENMQPYLALTYCIALQGIYPSRP